MSSMNSPWFLALDIDDRVKANDLARKTAPYVGGFKVGPRLCTRFGPALIAELAALRPVFVDNKYFDIPSTMEAAVRATFEAGASYVTVHAQAGAEALHRLAAVERELSQKRPFRVLAVTILTSFSQSGLPPVSSSMPIKDQVMKLADLVLSSGLTGIVCSSEEVFPIRQIYPEAFLVVPGIRLPGQGRGDQTRVADPQTAIHGGASALVVGRPVVESSDPVAAAKQIDDLCKFAARPQ